jgi:FKBP-type peptidyl-prolyl cis-trans isomerase (trigger factor)
LTKEAVVQIENLGSLDRKMTLQFNRADINQAREARLTKISKSMKMPGFRPGKVPKKMVEQQYGMQVDFEVQYDKATQLFYELSKQEASSSLIGVWFYILFIDVDTFHHKLVFQYSSDGAFFTFVTSGEDNNGIAFTNLFHSCLFK